VEEVIKVQNISKLVQFKKLQGFHIKYLNDAPVALYTAVDKIVSYFKH